MTFAVVHRFVSLFSGLSEGRALAETFDDERRGDWTRPKSRADSIRQY